MHTSESDTEDQPNVFRTAEQYTPSYENTYSGREGFDITQTPDKAAEKSKYQDQNDLIAPRNLLAFVNLPNRNGAAPLDISDTELLSAFSLNKEESPSTVIEDDLILDQHPDENNRSDDDDNDDNNEAVASLQPNLEKLESPPEIKSSPRLHIGHKKKSSRADSTSSPQNEHVSSRVSEFDPNSQSDDDFQTKREGQSGETQILKRNYSFQNLFDLPPSEGVIYQCTASLIRGIFTHSGTLYFSSNFVCFTADLFGIGIGLTVNETIKFADISRIFCETREQLHHNIINIETKGRTVQFSNFEEFGTTYHHFVSLWKGEDISKEKEKSSSTDKLFRTNDRVQFIKDPQSLKKIITFKITTSVSKVFQYLFSEESDFFKLYHETDGRKDFMTTEWCPHPEFGQNVRNLSYQAPLKFFVGPTHTRIEETQRYKWQSGTLIVESVSIMHDIPYSDFFCVNTLFQIKPMEVSEEEPKEGPDHESLQSQSILEISVGCHFSKDTFFREKITESTLERSIESYSKWVKLAVQYIQKMETRSYRYSKKDSPPNSAEPSLPHSESLDNLLSSQINQSIKAQNPAAFAPPPNPSHYLENITENYRVFLTFPSAVFALFIAFLFFFVWKIDGLSDRVQDLERELLQLKKHCN